MKVEISAQHLRVLRRTISELQKAVSGVPIEGKELPVWLPNGEPISNLEQMASMLNVDVKTAGIYVLQSKNISHELIIEAKARVKTPAGAEKFKEPIGSIITDRDMSAKEVKIRKGEEHYIRTQAGAERFGGDIGDLIRLNEHGKIEVIKKPKADIGDAQHGAETIDEAGKESLPSTASNRRKVAVRTDRHKDNQKFIAKEGMDRRGDSNGNKYGILKSYQLSDETKAEYEAGGIPTGNVHEVSPDDAQVFHDAISSSKNDNPFASSVYVYSPEEYKDMRLFMYEDGRSGFALKDGELVSVFSHSDEKTKGVAHTLLTLATQEGAVRLDCFDTVLPDLYSVHGFVAVARTPFNKEFQPDGWKKQTYIKYNGGNPDVVFMALDPKYFGEYKNDDGETIPAGDDSYDKCVALAKAQAEKNNPTKPPNSPKPKTRKPIKILDPNDVKQLHNGEGHPTSIRPLASNMNIEAMQNDGEKLVDVPDIRNLGEMDVTPPRNETHDIKKQTKLLADVYEKTEYASTDYDENFQEQNDAELKANVMHHISQRILDDSVDDPHYQAWIDATTQYLFFHQNPLTSIHRSLDNGKMEIETHNNQRQLGGNWIVTRHKFDLEQQQRFDTLRDFGLIDEKTSFQDAKKPDFEYAKFMNNEDSVSAMFPKTTDREKIVRGGILEALQLSHRYADFNYEPSDEEHINGFKREIDGFTTPKKPAKDFDHLPTTQLVTMYKVKNLVGNWAGTSADTNPDSVSLQLDVQEAFNIKDAPVDHFDADLKLAKKDKPIRDKFIKAVYAETQAFFKENGITHVEVYRGMKFQNAEQLPKFIKHGAGFDSEGARQDKMFERANDYADNYEEEMFYQPDFDELVKTKYHEENNDPDLTHLDKWIDEHPDEVAEVKKNYLQHLHAEGVEDFFTGREAENYDYQLDLDQFKPFKTNDALMQPISSWSLKKDIAERFTGNTGQIGAIFSTTVPVSRIFSTSFSGIGCLNEHELVVLGGKGSMGVERA